MSAPEFVVVGHVNKGKSTIVSTLTENDTLRIDPLPGTTKEVQRIEARLGSDRVYFSVLDTPGFQDAPAAFAWMQARSKSAADRPGVVADFVRTHRGSGEFADECALLQPVLDGASILYVADGNVPFLGDYEAELEILRWTGAAGMALLNPIQEHPDAARNTARWKTALEQYFKPVLDFNGHEVGFRERLELLATFRQLRPDWKAPLDEAIEAFRADWERRRRRSAELIADFTAWAARFAQESDDAVADAPARKYQEELRSREARARRQVEDLYRHHRGASEAELVLPPAEGDIFAEQTWKVFGLSPGKLLLAGTTSGAVAGGWVDAHLGGASMGTGIAVGALGGGVWALLQSAKRLPSLRRIARSVLGKKTWSYGPHPNPQFFWLLLDRALEHHRRIRSWSHGRQDAPVLQSVLRGLESRDTGPLRTAAALLRKRDLSPAERESFVKAVHALLGGDAA